jgi:hypothetical protein
MSKPIDGLFEEVRYRIIVAGKLLLTAVGAERTSEVGTAVAAASM